MKFPYSQFSIDILLFIPKFVKLCFYDAKFTFGGKFKLSALNNITIFYEIL